VTTGQRETRQRIKAGRLPVMTVTRIAAGYGFGHVCAACDKPITNPQVEYELDDYRDGRRLCFHQGCHVAWQLECAAAPPRIIQSYPSIGARLIRDRSAG
jgi:hypothetical protein